MYKRSIDLYKVKSSFFLWGPRQAGKSSLLKMELPEAIYIDLLLSDNFIKYNQAPFRLREELLLCKDQSSWVIIDEIQKIPALLDEVHWLLENRNFKFALCGSSARKLKRGHANLLGGRALRFELFGLTAFELKKDFDLETALNRGYLANHFLHLDYKDRLRSYCNDYLKEEIFAEGLVRNLPAFSSFLHTAAFSDSEQVEYATIASDVGVSAPTIKSYFEILEDTLIGQFIHIYRKRPKRRLQMAPKFYFFDVGVVNSLAKRGYVEKKSELFGKAFENWVFHELRCFKSYCSPDLDIYFWKLSSGVEVDFILNDLECAIEVKATEKITSKHLQGLRELKIEHPRVKRRIVVCTEKTSRITEDGIEILSYEEFIDQLWLRKIIS
ncbi:MAG TPA: AAA family ATPase [Pseudobdellovibrionaceae bacterium]|jgi:predicted AAA+ superfamily ATPase